MASNFRVQAQRKNDDLHLRLEGDFDGASAFAVIRVIGKRGCTAGTVFIDTNGLRDIHPFGREVFLRNLGGCGKHRRRLVFTGQKGPLISPQAHRLCAE
jgi:hypothetical protein